VSLCSFSPLSPSVFLPLAMIPIADLRVLCICSAMGELLVLWSRSYLSCSKTRLPFSCRTPNSNQWFVHPVFRKSKQRSIPRCSN
jgi:hypothetical protein